MRRTVADEQQSQQSQSTGQESTSNQPDSSLDYDWSPEELVEHGTRSGDQPKDGPQYGNKANRLVKRR